MTWVSVGVGGEGVEGIWQCTVVRLDDVGACGYGRGVGWKQYGGAQLSFLLMMCVCGGGGGGGVSMAVHSCP